MTNVMKAKVPLIVTIPEDMKFVLHIGFLQSIVKRILLKMCLLVSFVCLSCKQTHLNDSCLLGTGVFSVITKHTFSRFRKQTF